MLEKLNLNGSHRATPPTDARDGSLRQPNLQRASDIFQHNWFAIISLVNCGTNLFVLILVAGLFYWMIRIVQTPPPTLVLEDTGAARSAMPLAPRERTPESIQYFVRSWLTYLLSWQGMIVDEVTKQKIPDSGKTVVIDPDAPRNSNNTRRLTTPAWLALFATSQDLRPGLAARIGEMIPPEVFPTASATEGEARSSFELHRLSEPALVSGKEDTWYVDAIGTLTILFERQPAQMVKFNKRITVRAVPPAAYPYPPNQNELQRSVEQMRNGFEVIKVEDLET
jgi:hypothetical protein